jgi:hypothetical protein
LNDAVRRLLIVVEDELYSQRGIVQSVVWIDEIQC